MKDGKFTYYTLQHRRTYESPWLQPDEPLVPVCDEKWSFSNWDVFGSIAEPWVGSGNNWRPYNKKSQDETNEVRSNTEHQGWWTLKYALQGLELVRKADAEGKFDSINLYRERSAAVRHEFRLVKIVVCQSTSEVLVNDLVAELINS